jgi:hypothetical protein
MQGLDVASALLSMQLAENAQGRFGLRAKISARFIIHTSQYRPHNGPTIGVALKKDCVHMW